MKSHTLEGPRPGSCIDRIKNFRQVSEIILPVTSRARNRCYFDRNHCKDEQFIDFDQDGPLVDHDELGAGPLVDHHELGDGDGSVAQAVTVFPVEQDVHSLLLLALHGLVDEGDGLWRSQRTLKKKNYAAILV